eukprot:scaffold40943_cov19-Tisochrysis_lutea.AAC.2
MLTIDCCGVRSPQAPGRSSLTLPQPGPGRSSLLHPGPGRPSLSQDPRHASLPPPPPLPTAGLPASLLRGGAPSHAHRSPSSASPGVPLSGRSSVVNAGLPGATATMPATAAAAASPAVSPPPAPIPAPAPPE